MLLFGKELLKKFIKSYMSFILFVKGKNRAGVQDSKSELVFIGIRKEFQCFMDGGG